MHNDGERGGVTFKFQAWYKAETYIMKLLGEKKQQGHWSGNVASVHFISIDFII